MFSSNNTRPPPPSGRPPAYAFVTRVYKRTLRPVVIFCGILTCIWALVWAVDSFQDIGFHKQVIPQLATFDIVLGSLYSAVAVIEAYGIFAAVKSTIPLVRIYTLASLVALLCVLAAESMQTALQFSFKGKLIDECTKELTGAVVRNYYYFGGSSTNILSADDAQRVCRDWWNRGAFREVAWLIVALILGLLFVSIAFSFYRQVLDPSSVRTAPSTVYRLEARYPPPNGPIPGYAPYNPYPDYVPPYDPHKPPNYSQGGWTGPTGDEKEGGYGYGGAGATSTTNLTSREERDEGFDPIALQAAMKASEQEATNAPTKKNDTPGGSGTR